MLNREVAKAQLETIYQADWRSQQVQQLIALPEPLRSIGLGIINHDANGQALRGQEYYEIETRAFQQIDELPASDRLQILNIFFPKFADLVEATWQRLVQLPYPSGYARRAFRAPNHPEYSAEKRRNWLDHLIRIVEGYDQDLAWFAAWTPYLRYYAEDTLGLLFATAIEQNDALGQTIFDILIASASNNHEVGAMGRHVIRALLVANRSDGWELIERLLLAAQRQEGLRQSILETIDEANPLAFQRMLWLILDHNLIRFSATLRAFDVWLGFGLEVLSEKIAKQMIAQILECFESPEAHAAALQSDDPQTVYLALWTSGFKDAIAAIDLAAPLLDHPEATHRFVAVHFLRQLEITPARFVLLSAVGDGDLRVATAAVQALSMARDPAIATESDAFERLEQALPHFPTKPKTESIVWEWIKLEASQVLIASALLATLGDRSPKRLIPYLPLLDAYDRRNVAQKLAELRPWDGEVRATLFDLLGDASTTVRETVIRLLQGCTIDPPETAQLEQLLTRKASDLRRGILGVLLNQPDEVAIASAERLTTAKQAPQRQAGLELLRELVQKNRSIDRAQALATQYQTARSKLTTTENQLLTGILRSETEPTLTDALGLVKPDELTAIADPQVLAEVAIVTPSAESCLLAIDELIHEHHQTPVKIDSNGEEEELLGNLTWKFPRINPKLSREENLERLPLSDVWLNWWRDRTDDLRDPDGLELIRAIVPRFSYRVDPYGGQPATSSESTSFSLVDRIVADLQSRTGQTNAELRYPQQVRGIIDWLIYLHPIDAVFDYWLDAISTLLCTLPIAELSQESQWQDSSYYGVKKQIGDFIDSWIHVARRFGSGATAEQQIRWWHLMRWSDRHLPSYYGYHARANLWDVFNAYQGGGATEADVMFHLIGAEEHSDQVQRRSSNAAEAKANLRTSFHDLSELTRRNPPEAYAKHPFLLELADRARQRILAIELQRGDLPTAASNAALALRSVSGMSTVIQLIQALDRAKLVRYYSYNSLSKAAVLSHLMRVSFPATDDSPAEFAQRVRSAQIKTEHLIQFAFYAPQWVNYVEAAIEWSGFAEAVWWFHAHTKDNGWSIQQDIREAWVAQISERTPLSAQSLVEGAVDVEWFQRLYKILKADRWNQLYDAAQYASTSGGHQRAKLFADAMLGNLEAETLRDRITTKRHQDSVRALGLLPLAKGKQRDRDILDRYQILQEFLRTSKKFGSQRQASEKLAVSIGMENLARTAGFVDPIRLQWAMEAQAIADLVDRSQTVSIDQVSVSLSITPQGEPEITVTKQGKPLKSIPAKLKKQPEIQALTSRKQEITQQASRIRISLEQAMCRGDRFTAAELVQLAKHPVLFPMLSQLILIGDDGEIGYLVNQGTALQNHAQTVTPIRSSQLRIAHPHDLLVTQEWHLWQHDCFERDLVQPFKQIFRELYVPTVAEQKEPVSHRYEGHQVNPKQALALFGQRGWIASPEVGVRRTFHVEKLIAEVDFVGGFFTPLEIEGLTIEGVRFYRRDEWKPISLTDVPPRLFSEVMRDLDLVVSVAHMGGVDPEATASTVEMRSTLVRETCRLLKLHNVHLQSAHALIEGQLGSYSVHLGSAIVHRQPGGALCIVPVHSQQRGRIFLPFVDPDPKTAEVVSKVLLLARDKEIQDPTILQQLL
ncbi:DUF4132 domain-containing protein [Microcoleus sp. FACHB-1515]|uniref:DUF4132 domain-containing protein n=1 Tax=Cyanophyceae TaxID=3028117 RepID=UPI0016834926|nr:DUF4132 domain-containing protein [Microcoleus sp. FACHB-1515]MBD2092287.1 DUF4132 domain-containing protein [Microcoleus sp. FACHB-1515]